MAVLPASLTALLYIRITQRLLLSGTNAEALVARASILEQTTPQGMKKLVAAIEDGARS
jgi:hypothetical protein